MKAKPLYEVKHLPLWDNSINTFLPLRSNHRFKHDKHWGDLLQRFTKDCPTQKDIDFINTRITDDTTVIPEDATYAVWTNKNRCAINEGLFKMFLENNHSKDPNDVVPDYSICIMSSIESGKKWFGPAQHRI